MMMMIPKKTRQPVGVRDICNRLLFWRHQHGITHVDTESQVCNESGDDFNIYLSISSSPDLHYQSRLPPNVFVVEYLAHPVSLVLRVAEVQELPSVSELVL